MRVLEHLERNFVVEARQAVAKCSHGHADDHVMTTLCCGLSSVTMVSRTQCSALSVDPVGCGDVAEIALAQMIGEEYVVAVGFDQRVMGVYMVRDAWDGADAVHLVEVLVEHDEVVRCRSRSRGRSRRGSLK